MAVKILTIFLVLFTAHQCHGINYRDVQEGACIIPPLAQDLNVDWMVGISKWHMLLGSKYLMYRFTDSFQDKDNEEIDEEQVIDSLCLTTKLNKKGEALMQGFGRSLDYSMQIGEKNGIINWILHDAKTRLAGKNSEGISYITLTDNKTYFVAIQYWDVGQRSWVVLSTENTVSSEARNVIFEHVKTFGFDPDQALTLSYKTCSSKDEL